MFIHDLIKIHLSREGYLIGYPPHLISDEEMCDAFLPFENVESAYEEATADGKISYFIDMYPKVHDYCGEEDPEFDIDAKYKDLVTGIAYHLDQLKKSTDPDFELPNWVYNYMLGEVIGPRSDQPDKHYLFVMLGTDNLDDDFDLACYKACYKESEEWLKKVPQAERDHRPISLFGEMHVIKSLRLKAADIAENDVKDRIQADLTSGKQVT